jgi:SAM-dependent methyltransferase
MTLAAWLRFEVIQRLIPPDVESVLEIGAGRGALGRRLARRYRYVGVEIDPVSFDSALPDIQASGGELVPALEDLDPGSVFDLVCAFEVLEHIEDDRGALSDWSTRVAPGGHILLSVPAHPERFGPMDVHAGHYRRYSREALRRVLMDAGFEDVVVWAYGWPLAYVLERARTPFAARLGGSGSSMAERTGKSGRFLQPPDWLAPATMVAAAPFRLLQLPARETERGTGWVARGRLAAPAPS